MTRTVGRPRTPSTHDVAMGSYGQFCSVARAMELFAGRWTTLAGRELQHVIEAVGVGGTRWVPELGDHHLDLRLLLWDLHRNYDLGAMPVGRAALAFHLHDATPRARDCWVVVDDQEVDRCDDDPRYEVMARIISSLGTLRRVWLGELPWHRAVDLAQLRVEGPAGLHRTLPTWLTLADFASVQRPARAVLR